MPPPRPCVAPCATDKAHGCSTNVKSIRSGLCSTPMVFTLFVLIIFSAFCVRAFLALDDRHAAVPHRLNFELEIEADIAERCDLSEVDVRVINDAPLVA